MSLQCPKYTAADHLEFLRILVYSWGVASSQGARYSWWALVLQAGTSVSYSWPLDASSSSSGSSSSTSDTVPGTPVSCGGGRGCSHLWRSQILLLHLPVHWHNLLPCSICFGEQQIHLQRGFLQRGHDSYNILRGILKGSVHNSLLSNPAATICLQSFCWKYSKYQH